MKKKEISIIMPIYNADPFLAESLESILNQTFVNFELICINDGSNDLSAEMLRKYSALDDRIKIITNDTCRGAAEARNEGIRMARGEYLIFLDSDDIFETDMLELAYSEMEKKQVDIVMFEAMYAQTENIYDKVKVMHTDKYREKYCRKSFYLKEYEPWEMLNWTAAPWNKLYRSSFIKEKDLEFQSLPCSNDVYFVIMAYMSEAKLIVLDEERALIHVRNHNSLSRISFDRDPMCAYKAIEKLQKELLKRDLFKNVYAHFYYRAFYELIGAIRRTKSEKKAKEFYIFLANEGIRLLQKNGGGYYIQSDEYIQKAFENFEKKCFESNWYMMEGRLTIYLEKNKSSFINFIKNICKKQGICIWGAGWNGRILIDFFRKNELEIDSVVDMDEKKEGKCIEGYKIKNPEYLLDNVNRKYLVLVSSLLAIDAANKFAQERVNDITIVDIQKYLDM